MKSASDLFGLTMPRAREAADSENAGWQMSSLELSKGLDVTERDDETARSFFSYFGKTVR